MLKAFLQKKLIILFIACFAIKVYAQHDNAPVKIINKPHSPYIEIRNGLLGIVIPKENTFNLQNPQNTLAPIQSIIYKDGAYSNDSVVYLHSGMPPVSMKVVFLKSNAEECVVSIQYSFNKPVFVYGKETYKGGEAGPGYYKSTIALKRNSKSILIEEESDYDVWYQFKIGNRLQPDCARYRGWNSTSVENGHEPTGKIYRTESERGPMDATIDFNYNKPRKFPFLSLWDPLGGETNTGRYWQVFNNEAAVNANLVGFFQGRSSRLIGGRAVGPKLVISPDAGTNNGNAVNKAFIQIYMERREPDDSWYAKKRLQWALFISTKADLLPPDKYQPIGREMNYVSGLASRIDDYAAKPAEIVPAFFDGAIYMPANKIQDLIKHVKTDAAFCNKLNALDPYFKVITDAWRNPDSAKSAIRHYMRIGEEYKNMYKNGDGIHEYNTQYWKGSFRFKKVAEEISCLFADKSIQITASQKDSLLQVVRMLARTQWDDDNVPFFDSAGINFGPANMPYQYSSNGRNFFSMLFANDPEFGERAKKVAESTRANILSAISDNGISFGSPHYTQATIDPILFSMLQLKQSGIADLFTEQKNRLSKFIDFYTALLTPPSVRFNSYRKLISFGDGSEESAVTFALLASGLQDSDSALSKVLYSIFQNGPPRMSLFGDVSLAVDLAKDHSPGFRSASSNYTGYLSHFRSGINTQNETAVWILNGNGLFDHRDDDAGEIAIYALNAPLSLSRSCFYYPFVTDSRMRSVVVPVNMFPEWNKNNQSITQRSLTNRTWPISGQTEFAALGNSVVSISKMKMKEREWYRKVILITLKKEQPIILFYDSVNDAKPNIWSMPFMSQGRIITPDGILTPTNKTYTSSDKFLQLPDVTAEQTIPGGLNKFSFTGQSWPQKVDSTGGINWDLYTISNSSTSFTLSQWTNNWQNSTEAAEFLQTNGKPYNETQQILRIKSSTPFFHVLLPYFKGTNPYKNEVQLIGPGKIRLPYNNGEIILAPDFYFYSGNDKTVLASFSSQEIIEKNITISGGMAEVEIVRDIIKLRIHGNSGKRLITLPFLLTSLEKNNDVQLINQNKSAQITIDYKSKGMDLLSNEQGYTEYIFKKNKTATHF